MPIEKTTKSSGNPPNAGSVDKFVHCHLCPLKDHCGFSAADSSYHFHSCKDESWDLTALSMAAANCPLKKAVLKP
ncbi:MAG: hypothetical protein ACQCN6_01840 [Candidatus Bathyarchaeia archaeon]|jgi:hypothetical protein